MERIVKELEKGDLPLERKLLLFESGMKLSGGWCKKMLEEAETRVEILMKRGGETVAVPFIRISRNDDQERNIVAGRLFYSAG